MKMLETSLPPLDELPPDLIAHLQELELMDNGRLRLVRLAAVPVAVQSEIEALLDRNRADGLTEAEQSRLDELQRRADEVMLCKARAAVLLRFRGERLPTLSELRQLAEQR